MEQKCRFERRSHAAVIARAQGYCGGSGDPIDPNTRKQTSLLHFGLQDAVQTRVNPRLLPVFGPIKLRLYGPQRFKKVKLGRPTELALAMQPIVIFCNLEQQPTCISHNKKCCLLCPPPLKIFD